jgi:hypothetical protein
MVMRYCGVSGYLVNLKERRKASIVEPDGEHNTMSLYILSKEKLPEFVKALQARFRVVGPVRTETGYAFDDITEPAQLQLNYNTTVLPPKKYFLPQREVLFDFHSEADGNDTRHYEVGPLSRCPAYGDLRRSYL